MDERPTQKQDYGGLILMFILFSIVMLPIIAALT